MGVIFEGMADIVCFRNYRAWATFISWSQIIFYTIGLGLTSANLILVVQEEQGMNFEKIHNQNLPVQEDDFGYLKTLAVYSDQVKSHVEWMCIFTAGIVFGALLFTGIIQNKKIYFYLWKLFALGSCIYVMIFTVMNPTSVSNLFMILFVGLNCFAFSIVSRLMAEISTGTVAKYASKTGATEDAEDNEDDVEETVLLGGKKYSQFNDEYTLIPEGYIF